MKDHQGLTHGTRSHYQKSSATDVIYPLAPVRVKIDEEEYCVKPAIVQDLAEEVLLGRDVPLHKHLVKRLPKGNRLSCCTS